MKKEQTTLEWIEEKLAIAAKATEGPLNIERRDECSFDAITYIVHGERDFAKCSDDLDPRAKFNAAFIADARTTVEQMGGMLKVALEALEYYRGFKPAADALARIEEMKR